MTSHFKSLNEHKIVLVDDDVDFVNLLKSYFSWIGFSLADFTNPLLTLDHYRNNRDLYSLIILDWRMPLMNGLILATKIRQINKSVKIVMITAYNICDIKAHSEYESVRLDQILQKPVRLSLLKEIVNNLLTV